MKNIILLAALSLFGSTLFSQISIDSVLSQVAKNNTTLSAFRKNTDAEKIGNKTGIYLQNPELGVNYLLGNPDGIGNRTDFSLTQSFDFPTAYAYKNQLSNLMNETAELEYQKQRKEILLQTRLVCVELTYQNALKAELSKRLNNATQIANAYKSKFNIGDAGILEFNKAQVNLLNSTKAVEANEIERNALLAELARLNGGVVIEFNDSIFVQTNISPDFEQWYAQVEQGNPVLQWIKQEIVVSQKQKQLSSALSLPKFNAGYMSEKVVGQQFQGISVGVSIPLWENKNTVKYAKAKTIAIQSMETDAKLQFYNQMKALHLKVVSLQISATDYRQNLNAYSNADLLQKALDKGEISLSEYIFELSLYYESINKLLEMEMNLNVGFAELIKYQ
ncbi:MAG: TolC family protein [Salinivirgaceae bacterium]